MSQAFASLTAGQQSPFQKASRSSVWQHFRRGDGSVECLICAAKLKYNGGTTSNLAAHLKKRHKSETDQTNSTKHAQTKLTQFAAGVAQPSTKICTVTQQDALARLLSRWIWMDMRPIALVEDKGLRALLRHLEPGYKIPSRTHLTTLIKKQWKDGQEALGAVLKTPDFISLTTDIWTSRSTQALETTTAHFLSSDWEFKRCVLETRLFSGSHTGENCREDQDFLGAVRYRC